MSQNKTLLTGVVIVIRRKKVTGCHGGAMSRLWVLSGLAVIHGNRNNGNICIADEVFVDGLKTGYRQEPAALFSLNRKGHRGKTRCPFPKRFTL